MTPSIAVILFPGTNCELEALRACERANMKGEVFRWNDNKSKLRKYDGYFIPGGFSYEDRGRSGVIASKDPIMEVIKKEANNGKVVIGICNGAQILVEAGMIPGLTQGELEMGLNWNERINKGKILGVGFYNEWIYIKNNSKKGRSAFNNFEQDVIMRIPIAHAEGRFTIKDQQILKNLIKNEQTLFRYCDKDGNIKEQFPTNPNGAIYNLAGVCNPEGNVMSLMPHPERTEVAGQPIFDSMSEYLTKKFQIVTPKIQKIDSQKTDKTIIEKQDQKPDIEITVELIITDNEERTLENTMKNIGFKDLKLKRKIYYEITAKDKDNLKKIAARMIKSGEIVNLNKEIPTITIGENSYSYDKKSGLTKITKKTERGETYFVSDYDNFAGKTVLSKLQAHFPSDEITKIEKGVMWNIKLKKQDQTKKLIQTHIFHNPNAMKLVALK